MPLLFAAADVLVLTSTSEGSPVSVMEALAGGVPIVATDVGDVKSMVSGVPNCYSGAYDCGQFVRWVEAVDRTVLEFRRRGAGASTSGASSRRSRAPTAR